MRSVTSYCIQCISLHKLVEVQLEYLFALIIVKIFNDYHDQIASFVVIFEQTNEVEYFSHISH